MNFITINTKIVSASASILVFAAMLSTPLAVQATGTDVSDAQAERIAARRAARRAARQAERVAARNEPTDVCFYNVADNLYELKTFRAAAVARRVTNNDLYSYPIVGDDGSQSCIVVEAPGSDCTVVLSDGIEYTVADFIAAGTAPTHANSDFDSCDITVEDAAGTSRIIGLFNRPWDSSYITLTRPAGIFFGTGTSFIDPENGVLFDTEEEYQECALAVEIAVAQSANLVVNGGDGNYVCPEFEPAL